MTTNEQTLADTLFGDTTKSETTTATPAPEKGSAEEVASRLFDSDDMRAAQENARKEATPQNVDIKQKAEALKKTAEDISSQEDNKATDGENKDAPTEAEVTERVEAAKEIVEELGIEDAHIQNDEQAEYVSDVLEFAASKGLDADDVKELAEIHAAATEADWNAATDAWYEEAKDLPEAMLNDARDAVGMFFDPDDPQTDWFIDNFGNHPKIIEILAAAKRGGL